MRAHIFPPSPDSCLPMAYNSLRTSSFSFPKLQDFFFFYPLAFQIWEAHVKLFKHGGVGLFKGFCQHVIRRVGLNSKAPTGEGLTPPGLITVSNQPWSSANELLYLSTNTELANNYISQTETAPTPLPHPCNVWQWIEIPELPWVKKNRGREK